MKKRGVPPTTENHKIFNAHIMNIKSPRRLANTQVGASTRNKGFIVINVNLLISNKIGYFFLGCFVSHICNSCICFAFFVINYGVEIVMCFSHFRVEIEKKKQNKQTNRFQLV